MSFELFDTTRLNIKPLNERVHDIDLLEVLVPVDDSPAPMDNEKVRNIAKALCEAKQKKSRFHAYVRSACYPHGKFGLYDRAYEKRSCDTFCHKRSRKHP